jgi:tetratricopeptide (TPR) repeat protein
MLNTRSALFVSALGFALVACGGFYAQRGTDLYAGGRYVEAAEVFEHAESRLATASPDQQAEYGLYRGATLLALKDYDHARRWLSYAYKVEQAHPGSLATEHRDFLYKTWAALSEGPRSPEDVAPRGTATAIAASVSPGSAEAAPSQAPGLVPTQRSFAPQ